MARYIFITGGVVSSLGKGLMAASLAALLQARGYKVRIRKFDPYLNVDPGTMSPYQHGEVYVTDEEGGRDPISNLRPCTNVFTRGFSRAERQNHTAVALIVTSSRVRRRGDYLRRNGAGDPARSPGRWGGPAIKGRNSRSPIRTSRPWMCHPLRDGGARLV